MASGLHASPSACCHCFMGNITDVCGWKKPPLSNSLTTAENQRISSLHQTLGYFGGKVSWGHISMIRCSITDSSRHMGRVNMWKQNVLDGHGKLLYPEELWVEDSDLSWGFRSFPLLAGLPACLPVWAHFLPQLPLCLPGFTCWGLSISNFLTLNTNFNLELHPVEHVRPAIPAVLWN